MNSLYPKAPHIDLEPSLAKTVRHFISTGLSFINASVDNLASTQRDTPEALKMYSIGKKKLNEAITKIDISNQLLENAADLGYSGVIENTFTAEHADVAKWTRAFEQKVNESQIFSKFESDCPRSVTRAEVVAFSWHKFSSFMPWFLCQAAAMVSSNEKRHYVIQTAFEELGMRDSQEIHPDMFLKSAQSLGLHVLAEGSLVYAVDNALSFLRKTLLTYNSDEEILGILLGLEIPAQQNIETVFFSLAHNDLAAQRLNEHKFFKLHRQIEVEHVRLTVSNFLRFCKSEEEKNRFTLGFMDGLKFWRSFWDMNSKMISSGTVSPGVVRGKI